MTPPSSAVDVVLAKHASLVRAEDFPVIERLFKEQPHLLDDFDPDPSAHLADKRGFFEQILRLHANYDLFDYHAKAKKLLSESDSSEFSLGKAPSGARFSRMEVPSGVSVNPGSERFSRLENIGVRNAASAVFVLVAGGLGERLGYSGIKVSLAAEISTNTCFLKLFIEHILALQHRCRISTTDVLLELPLVLMTSDDTHVRTIDLLKENSNFGMSTSQLFFIKQEPVPCLGSLAGEFVKSTPYSLMTKPHGHGDVHSLLHRSGLVDRFSNSERRSWICFFQDTNALVFRGLVSALGVSAEQNFHVNSICVPRLKGEQCGGLAKLCTESTDESLTVNVEYNFLRNESRQFPGSINALIFKLHPYAEVLRNDLHSYPEFVNPKFEKNSKKFKKPTRVESLMQDYPKLSNVDRVGFTLLPRHWCFSALKNDIQSGEEKRRKTGVAESALSCEKDIYALNREIMRMFGCRVERGEERAGDPGGRAQIVLEPKFGATLEEIRARFRKPEKVKISSNSTLVLGGNVVVENLELDGKLVVRAVPGARIVIKRLVVKNAGQIFIKADNVRGYERVERGSLEIFANRAGDVVVDRTAFHANV